MLISLNWLSEFVVFPRGLEVKALAEQFTRITAEVDDVRPVRVGARGLVAARVEEAAAASGTMGGGAGRFIVLDAGGAGRVRVYSNAMNLGVGSMTVFAPVGATLASRGEIRTADVQGVRSEGYIPSGAELGIPGLELQALLLPPGAKPGESLSPELFEDWLIEVDNKSITHRPDLWGHYGIAREMAAILKTELRPYPRIPIEDWSDAGLEEAAIRIDRPEACPRYSGLMLAGLATEPSPLAMQLRLGRVGLRPIDAIVDLTNYVMVELGQPMHAFDRRRVDRIEVDFAAEGDAFTTLDGVRRALPREALMILSGGRPVALAGIMGGLESEVVRDTREILLESANFNPAVIRRCASFLGLRTDASARFEKGQDPENTVTAIQRFVQLARVLFPKCRITSRVTDKYPSPPEVEAISVQPRNVERTLGVALDAAAVAELLEPLDFTVTAGEDGLIEVEAPSFRATKDIAIEADVIEEIARMHGYNALTPAMPMTTIRSFEPNAIHAAEREALRHFCDVEGFCEIHGYTWYGPAQLEMLAGEVGDCITLRNPAATGQERLRRTVMPDLLESLTRNRFHFDALRLIEVGSVFEPKEREFRHVGLLIARKDRKAELELLDDLKGMIRRWMRGWLGEWVHFGEAMVTERPAWMDAHRSASIRLEERPYGELAVVPRDFRQRLSEHLAAWSAAWAEIRLDELAGRAVRTESLITLPAFPLVELDFSFIVDSPIRFSEMASRVRAFWHPLLKRCQFIESFEGANLGEGRRSLTLRAVIGSEDHTLVEGEIEAFSRAFHDHLEAAGYKQRG